MKCARRVGAVRAVQVSFHCDPQKRDAETLLHAWPTLAGVATAVARAGGDVTVVQAAAARQTVQRDNVTFHFVDDARGMPARLLGKIPIIRRPGRIIDRVASLSPDVVHVQGFATPVAVWQLMRALPGVPVLVQDHASYPPSGMRRLAWRASYRSLAAAAFTVRAQADAFLQAGILPSAIPVFEVLESSSDCMPGDQSVARRATGLFGDPCLLWTGHLDGNKDPLVALEAFRLAAPSLRDARLWCCFGKAPLLDAVRRRIDESPVLRERVTLLGRRPHEDMEAHFRAADFFIQTSHREGCGYSILEALACGTPPLVTDIPSSRRLVGTAGSLTPVGDASALAKAIVAWARRDPVQRRRAARAWFEHSLSFDRIGTALCDAYTRLAEQ
jgi:glycosyltransferase involved in cell wall biosynthesis